MVRKKTELDWGFSLVCFVSIPALYSNRSWPSAGGWTVTNQLTKDQANRSVSLSLLVRTPVCVSEWVFMEKTTRKTKISNQLLPRLEEVEGRRANTGRTFVTLSYAQSIDGSIAVDPNRRLRLSGTDSLRLTHRLRAAHDGILVGINTVLSDDPMLDVRFAEGDNPQPVVVDSRLRMPVGTHLIGNGRRTWVATTDFAENEAQRKLESQGATVIRLPALANGWVDLGALGRELCARRIKRLLVEGGARVITSFLRARLVDYVVVTISPRFVGGYSAVRPLPEGCFPRMARWSSYRLGEDLVVAGELDWTED